MAGSMTPAGVANQALDAVLWPEIIGDLEEGTDQSKIVLRSYGECIKQLLRAAPWDFARKEAPLTLLADRTGNTANVGTLVPGGWTYEYSYPIDCAKMRFIPANFQNSASDIPPGNIEISPVPQVSGLGQQQVGTRIRPTRFLVSSDFNYPIQGGPQPWDVPGVSPQGRVVILSNVREARGVYTAQMVYPSMWDSLFRSAFVAYLASEIAGPIWAKKDPKMGLTLRNQQIPIVQAKVREARLTSANEGGPPTSDIPVDWMQTRYSGGPWSRGWGGGGGLGGDGPGVWGYGDDQLILASGAVF